MTYLITQILLCLIIAFILGLIIGYLLCKICCCRNNKTNNAEYEADAAAPAAFASNYADVEDDTAMISLDTNVDLDGDGYDIESLEGIGPQTGDLFRKYGVASVADYLRKLHTSSSREQAAKDLNILVKPLHDWASMADLLRVEGIDHQYAELVHATGIQTVSELSHSNPDELLVEMETVNNAGKQLIAPNLPSSQEVNDWVARARGMAPVVTV